MKMALLIGVGEYGFGLNPLPAAPKDVEAMQQVLEHPEIGGFDQVIPLINPDRQAMEEAIYTLFDNRKKDDLLLLFFSGHGVKDENGKLYLAARNTCKQREALFRPTAVAASVIQDTMSSSRSRHQVVILDCCFSGAFAEGMKAKDDGSVPVKQQLGGEGRAVLTSSTSTQYSFEYPGSNLSIYTYFLVEGIGTGVADRDNDGEVSVDELHEYASEKVQEAAPAKMKPEIYPIREGSKILLAKVRVEDPKLKYRKEVERRVENGKISTTARVLLDLIRDSLVLPPEEAAAIETEVLKPYRDYEANLQRYERVLIEAMQHESPLNDATRNDLKDLQQHLSLRDEDVTAIESRIEEQESQRQAIAHKRLGDDLYNQGKLEEAITAYHEAIALNPNLAEAHLNLANILYAQDRVEEAIIEYEKTISIAPNNVQLQAHLGSVLYTQDRLDDAIVAYRTAISLDSKNAELWVHLGNVLYSQDKLNEAMTQYREAISIKPDLAVAYNGLGYVLLSQGKLDEAIKAYKQAIYIKDDLLEAYSGLGAILYEQGKQAEAVTNFKKARDLLRVEGRTQEANEIDQVLQGNQGWIKRLFR